MKKLSIVNWNVQRKNMMTGYALLSTVRSHLENFEADIIILQEMCDAKESLKGIKKINNYHVYIPKKNQKKYNRVEGYNFNVVLSRYPIVESTEIIFPKYNDQEILQNGTRVKIKLGDKHLMIYNCQLAIIKAGIATRAHQLEHVLKDAKRHKGPTIVCGDMNDVVPKPGWKRGIIATLDQEPLEEMFVDGKFVSTAEKILFNKIVKKYGFKESLDLRLPTWSIVKSRTWEMFKLKLDWFIVKDLKVKHIKLDDYITDHKSIEAEVAL